MGDQYGCKNRQDAREYSSDQRTDQSNATGGFGERDLPAKTHKTVLPTPPALVPTSQIPLSNTQIESAIDHSIKQEFFNTIGSFRSIAAWVTKVWYAVMNRPFD